MAFPRRTFLAGAAASLAAPAIASTSISRRVSGLTTHRWQDHFDNRAKGCILCDTDARVLFFWADDNSDPRIFPTSVPLTDELTRRGRTEVTLKRPAPEWRPTPSMLERNPDLPTYVGPGAENPLGTRALNLSWEYYRIHGTNDVRKIGRRSSNGCIGLFNPQIEWLYEQAQVGTQVVLI